MTAAAGWSVLLAHRRSRSMIAPLFAAVVVIVAASAPATAGMIAFWPGDGNANSSVGGHTGTLQNGAGYAAGQFGQQAFSLTSGSAYVSVADSPAWDFGGNPFTIAMYVNFNAIEPGTINAGGNALMGHDEGPGAVNKWFFSYTADGKLGFHINSTGGSGVFITSPSASLLSTGTWNLLAITRSGSTWSFYSNGASLGTTTDSTAIPSITAALTIGQTGEALGYVDGRMQNVAIFDTAMTAAEITAALTPVPEPTTWALAIMGIACGAFAARRRTL